MGQFFSILGYVLLAIMVLLIIIGINANRNKKPNIIPVQAAGAAKPDTRTRILCANKSSLLAHDPSVSFFQLDLTYNVWVQAVSDTIENVYQLKFIQTIGDVGDKAKSNLLFSKEFTNEAELVDKMDQLSTASMLNSTWELVLRYK